MKKLSTFLIASAALVSVGSQAHALDCVTNTPVEASDGAGLLGAVFGGPTVNMDGTATCDTLSTADINTALDGKADKADTYTKGEVDADNASQDAAISANTATNASQQTEIDANTASNTAQDATLADHENRITDNESDIGDLQTENASQQTEIDSNTAKNVDQDGRLDGHDADIADHETRITANKDKNDQQDATLIDHDSRITTNTNKNIQQDTRLDGHDTQLANHNARLNAHDDILAGHGETLEDHAKGLAIAMALPDAWLSDSKSFGIFGSVGGFDDETALGFAAIGRLDETWSVNGKLGADTDFDHFGWQAGFGAQW